MHKTLLFSLILFIGGAQFLQAQTNPRPQVLRGKQVALYLTKKQFSYDDSYNFDLSQFIIRHRGEDAVVDNIKLESLIALGEILPPQMEDSLGADSAFFLNEKPEMARAFLEQYDIAMGHLGPLGPLFDDTDIVMVITPIVLGNYTATEVYVRSNRIINEPRRIRTARMGISFYRPSDGSLISEFNTCLDLKKEKPALRFDFYNKTSKMGMFLARLFSKAFDQIEAGEKEGCE